MNLRQLPHRAMDRFFARRLFAGLREEGLGKMPQRRFDQMVKMANRAVSRGLSAARRQTSDRFEAWAAPSMDRSAMFEAFEPRVLLDGVLSGATAGGEFAYINDEAGGAATGVIMLSDDTTNTVTVAYTITGGVLTDLLINLPDDDAANTYTVRIAFANSSAAAAPTIRFNHLEEGDVVNLTVINDTINDNDGGMDYSPITTSLGGDNFSVKAANYVAGDSGLAKGALDGKSSTPLGDIGAVTFDAVTSAGALQAGTFGGGTILIRNTAAAVSGGSVATTTFSNGVTLGATALSLTVTSDNDAVTGVTVAGDTKIAGAASFNIVTNTKSVAGAAISVSAGDDITLTAAGGLGISTAGGSALGAVTLGDIAISGAGGVAVTTSVNANITGAVNVGTITSTGAGGTGDVTIDPTGTGDFGGSVSIGAINLGAATNTQVTIGSADAAFGAGVTLNGLSAIGAGGGLSILGNGIAGTLNLGVNNYYITNGSDFNITMGTADGGAGGFGTINTGTLIVGENAANSIDIAFAGGGGAVTFGDLINYAANVRNINITFDSDADGDAIASFTAGNVYIGDIGDPNDPNPLALPAAAIDNDGNINLIFNGGITGNFTLLDVTIGDEGEVDLSSLNVSIGVGTDGNLGGTFNVDDILLGGPATWFNVTIEGSSGAMNVDSFTSQSFAFDSTWIVDSDSSGGDNLASFTVGPVQLNAAGSWNVDSNSAVTGNVQIGAIDIAGAGGFFFEAEGIGGATTVGAITSTGATASGNVGVTLTGTGDFGGLVTLAPINLGLDTDTSVNIGGADSSFTALTLNGLLAIGGGGGLFITGNGIAGALGLGANNYEVDNGGDFDITMLIGADPGTGGYGTINTGNLILGPNAANDIDIIFDGGGGAVTFGHLVNYSNRDINITFDADASGDTVASFTTGDIFGGNEGNARDPLARPFVSRNRDGDINIRFGGGVTGAVNVGDITMGDEGFDGHDLVIAAFANEAGFGSFTGGSIEMGGNWASVLVDTHEIGSIGGITLGDITILPTAGGFGGNNVVFGHVGGATAATSLGDLNLQDITVNGSMDIIFQARDIDNVNITSTWSFNSSGTVTITADAGPGGIQDGVLGTFGADDFNVVFGTAADTAALIFINAADGGSSFTFNTIDHLNGAANWSGSAPRGGIVIDLDSDGDTHGPFTTLTVRNPGPDTTDNIVWGDNSNLIAEQGASIILAGGASGGFNITAGDGNDDMLGSFIIGQDFNGDAVDDSDFTGVLNVNDGIGQFLIRGVGSQIGAQANTVDPGLATTIRAATINANADGATENSTIAPTGPVGDDIDGTNLQPIGTMPDITVPGVSGADSFVADLTAQTFGAFTVTRGNWSSNITTNVATNVDRAAISSTVTYVHVLDGNINQNGFNNDFFIDDGFIADGIDDIFVTAVAKVFGDADLGFLSLDPDALGAVGAPRDGGLPDGINVSGHLVIDTLDTFAGADVLALTDARNPLNDIGPIRAGQSVSIGTLESGGHMNSIVIVNATGSANDVGDTLGDVASPSIFIGGLFVAGDVENIATAGALGEDIAIGGGSFIIGDLDTINAGLGNVTIGAPGLRIVGGVQASPFWVITDTGVNYFIDLLGSDAATAVLDSTVVFPVGGEIIGNGLDNSVTINNLTGLVDEGVDDDTRVNVATRLAPGIDSQTLDDASNEFDVTGFFVIRPLGVAGPDLLEFRIGGDLLGPIGTDINPFDGLPDGNPLGYIHDLKILGSWDNAESSGGASNIFLMGLGEIAYAYLLNDAYPGALPIGTDEEGNFTYSTFSSDTSLGQLPSDIIIQGSQNANGSQEALEVFQAMSPTNEIDTIINIPDGASVTKVFVGPNGTLETITFTDLEADGVLNTVVIDIIGGIIGDIHLFGENIGIEFNTADPLNPATNENTNIWYGVDQAGVLATNPAYTADPTDLQAIAFLEFSSQIGNITVLDTVPGDAFLVNVGNSISIGYVVVVDSASDISNNGGLSSYINDNNDGTGNSSMVPLDIDGNPVYAGLGNVYVEGSLGPIVSSGGVGSIQTVDTANDADADGVPDAHFTGLVTDGSAGAIDIDGNVTRSLVVGDRVILSTGANQVYGGGDDVIGINGNPAFNADINVAGSIGTSQGRVTTLGTDPASPLNVDGNPFVNGQLPSIAGDEVSAPDGIGINITAGEAINTAIVSGKRAAVALPDGTFADAGGDLTGNITASEIFGDIWAGGSIGTDGGGQQIVATGLGVVNAGGPFSGNIGDGLFPNRALGITATGASPGNIYADILAAGNMVNIVVTAGSGTGGSILGNIVAGTDGSGSIVSTNINSSTLSSRLLADENIGNANHTNFVSAADNIGFYLVESGRQTHDGPTGGDINSDFLAGTVGGLPVQANINSSTLPIFDFGSNDSITVTNLLAGWNVDTNGDDLATNDLDSNLNGTFVAAGSISLLYVGIDGNATGNDGVPGGHIAAAGMGNKESLNTLEFGTTFSSGISGILNGTLSAGMFVPNDQAGPNPINPADVGALQAGTVLSLGEVIVGNNADGLHVGAWDQSATGSNGADGITLHELLDEAELGANASYAPNFSIGATHNIDLHLRVAGLPSAGNTAGTVHLPHNVDPGTGDATDVSIAAFGSVNGHLVVADTADINFVLSNIDAVTAINANSGNPSAPGTALPLNAGGSGSLNGIGTVNNLNITSNGAADGGLDVEYFLAGLDPFVLLGSSSLTVVGGFWSAFGLGSIDTNLTASDAHPSDGLEAGNLSFALIAAGQNVNGNLYADNDIISRLGRADTDGSALIPGDYDADVIAGASANFGLSALASDSLFPGGNMNANITAGDDILSQDNDGNLMTIAAIGNEAGGTGDVNGNITSGTVRQLAGPDLFDIGDSDSSGDIFAFVLAGDDVNGTIDAGDTGNRGGEADGSFTGGVWAGGGVDLDIYTTVGNSFRGDINGNILTGGNLDVRGLGILAEDDIDGYIGVGFGVNGGNLLGNVIAEGDINTIEVWGNLGAEGESSIIFAGDDIGELAVGNPMGYGSVAGHNSLLNTSTFGTVYADVYIGGSSGWATPHIHIGQGFAEDAVLIAGLENGLRLDGGGATVIEQFGRYVTFNNAGNSGTRMVISLIGGNFGDTGDADAPGYGPDVWLYNRNTDESLGSGPTVGLTVTGNGAAAGLGQVIAVDSLDQLHVIDGSVRQVIVDDDIDMAGRISDLLDLLGDNDYRNGSLPFVANSLNSVKGIEYATNNAKLEANLNIINVDYNLGVEGESINAGLTGIGQDDNVAVWVQGTFTGSITSETGSVGNIVVHDTDGSTSVNAEVGIGDFYLVTGSIGLNNVFSALTGNVGVLNAQNHVDVNANSLQAGGSVGGLIARQGNITATVGVHGSIGLIQAAGNITATLTSATGDIGFDLDVNDIFSVVDGAGIYSDVGTISVNALAGDSIGNTLARTGSISASYNAHNDVGSLIASGFVSGNVIAETGDFQDENGVAMRSLRGDVFADATVGGDMGSVTAVLGDIDGSSYIVGGNLGQVTAGNDIDELALQVGGNAAGVTAGDDIDDSHWDIAGALGNVTAGSNIGRNGRLSIEAGSVGNITATGGDIEELRVLSETSIGNLSALNYIGGNGGYGGYTVELIAGTSVGDITSVAGEISGVFVSSGEGIGNVSALLDIGGYELVTLLTGGSIGNITSTAGAIYGVWAQADVNIGNIRASHDVIGDFAAETGSIGNITSAVGNINITAIAGQNIGNVTATVGTIASDVTRLVVGNVPTQVSYFRGDGGPVRVNVPVVEFNEDFWEQFSIDLTVAGVGGLIQAGGTIGAITAFGDISNYVIAGNVVTSVASLAGNVGGTTPTTVRAHGRDGENDEIEFDVNLGGLAIIGVTSVGNVTSGNDIGSSSVELTAENSYVFVSDFFGTEVEAFRVFANDRIGINSGNVWIHAINESIGNITAQGGSIVKVRAVAGTSMGNISASEDIFGTYIAEDGSIGNVITQVGDIGSPTNRAVFKANGGVEIDLETLTYTAETTDPTDPGIGNIFAEIGSIWANVITGTNVGTVAAEVDGKVIGGIAAPIGIVDVLLRAGGNVGGVSGGLGTVIQPTSIVLGRIGLIRNVQFDPNAGPVTVNGITPGNGLDIIGSNGVHYLIEIGDGSASASYLVNEDGSITFTNVTFNPNDGGDDGVLTNNFINILTRTGPLAGSPDSAVLVQVDSVTVNGNLFSILVEGNLDDLQVAGNLAGTLGTPGLLQTEGTIGTVHATGNIGVDDGTPGNDTAAPGLVIKIGKGVWSSLTAGGTNFGLTTRRIDSNSSTADPQFVSWTNTLGNSDSSTLDDVIYAYIGSGAANLTINNGFIEQVDFEGKKASNFTVLASAAGVTEAQLAAQLKLVQGGNGANDVASNLVSSGPDVVKIGTIQAAGSKFTLKGLTIEGDVDDIQLPGKAAQVAVTGRLGRIFAAKGVNKLVVRDAGVIDGGTVLNNISVQNNADVIKATKTVKNVQVGGNAGILTAGRNLVKSYVGGSALSVGASVMKNVQVVGSVGASYAAGVVGLGSAFTAAQIADLLGVTTAGLEAIGNIGPNGDLFYGGIQAHRISNTAVGGLISNLIVTGPSAQLGNLFNATLDDASVFTRIDTINAQGRRVSVLGLFVKTDGVITHVPDGFDTMVLA